MTLEALLAMIPPIPELPENPRDAFQELLGLLHNGLCSQLDTAINDGFTEELQAAYKALHPKKKWDQVKAFCACPEVNARWEPITKQVGDTYFAQQKAIKDMLDDLAEKAEVHPGEEWNLSRSVSNTDYNTQGFGADRYARASVEQGLPVAAMYGLEAEIRVRYLRDSPTWKGSPKTNVTYYEMWVKASPLDIEILKRKPGLTMKEWIAACWRAGTNPRVYNPFLPHGLEEKLGVDYFGNIQEP